MQLEFQGSAGWVLRGTEGDMQDLRDCLEVAAGAHPPEEYERQEMRQAATGARLLAELRGAVP